MENKYKVAFATGSRADYGIVRKYISMLNEDPSIDFSILATGALLDEKFGNAKTIVEEDGFRIAFECKVDNKSEKLSDTTNIMAFVLQEFGKFFEENKYDLLLILGDRYEIYSVAIAAAMNRIPILHMHGGEITLANYDEFIRHSITKMARFHFTSTEEYRKRVIQMGENPENVYYLGALGAENCKNIDMNHVDKRLLEFPEKKIFTVLFHPETLNAQSPLEQINELLLAINNYIEDYQFVFIGSNADTASDIITNRVQEYCKEKSNAHFFVNLHPDSYHYLVKNSLALIGNSSSGIIEVPSLGSFTINIGNRQAGRVRGNSVIDVICNCKAIDKAIVEVINIVNYAEIENPYYKKNSAILYYQTTKKILAQANKLDYKKFYDICYLK